VAHLLVHALHCPDDAAEAQWIADIKARYEAPLRRSSDDPGSMRLPWVAGVFVLALLLSAWRLLRGPSLPDRILALDTLYINALALLVVLGLLLGTACTSRWRC
jgi:hypothetical protein